MGQTARSLARSPRSRLGQATILPNLNYYLTFIRYFGFSINPADHDPHQWRGQCHASPPVSANELPAGAASSPSQLPAGPGKRHLNYERRAEALREPPTEPPGQRYRIIWLLLHWLGVLIKYMAIASTTFITANHCVVLLNYILQNSKTFMELILEIRLAITKFSALIFVLSWHWNQLEVRRLIRLVKSTSIYILSARSAALSDSLQSLAHEPLHAIGLNRAVTFAARTGSLQGKDEQQMNEDEQQDAGRSNGLAKRSNPEKINQVLDRLNSSILRWWLMCVCVTMLHFSVSEAELLRSYHLWQWLDDYSLHSLNNATISESTLMLLVSLDNYIYTVHVYGTRLVGASIICIVCSLQSENIATLELQALRLTRASPKCGQLASHATLCSWRLDNLGVVADCSGGTPRQFRRPSGPSGRQLHAGTSNQFFILAESDWFPAGQDGRAPAARGYLSEPICSASTRLSQLARSLASCLGHLAARHYALARNSRASIRPKESFDSTLTTATLVEQASRDPWLSTRGNASIDQLAWPSNYSSPGTPTSTRSPTLVGEGDLHLTRNRALSQAKQIERHLERLASKYELVRTVNAQIDACFGPMMLIQYSFLFLMSCVDVVYFSISFNPNTKTKIIILTGMILLWWPYLLLYKFASDISCRSKDLLISVRRLARLSLVEHHRADEPTERETATLRFPWRSRCRLTSMRTKTRAPFGYSSWTHPGKQAPAPGYVEHKSRSTIINKLDHVFKPTYLTLLGIMKVNKFFLLNFAKIVITASVMMIQFIFN